MRSALLLILAFCCSFARADIQSIQYLHEVSNNAYLFTASMMVYFNPKDRTPDERSLTAAFGAINVMDTKITQLGNTPDMRKPLDEMNSIFLARRIGHLSGKNSARARAEQATARRRSQNLQRRNDRKPFIDGLAQRAKPDDCSSVDGLSTASVPAGR